MRSPAESNGRSRSGAYSREKLFIAELSDSELSEAFAWSRFAEDWKQTLLVQEQERRNTGEPIRESIPLTHAQWRTLACVAAQTGSLAERGDNAGNPSWRTLLRRIADGELLVRCSDEDIS